MNNIEKFLLSTLAASTLATSVGTVVQGSNLEELTLRPTDDILVHTGLDGGFVVSEGTELMLYNDYPDEGQIYLRFDTSKVPGDSEIEQATLRLYKIKQADMSFNIIVDVNYYNKWKEEDTPKMKIPNDWTTSTPYTGFGYFFNYGDFDRDVASRSITKKLPKSDADESGWFEVDVTNLLSKDRDGVTTFRLRTGPEDGRDVRVASKEYVGEGKDTYMGPELEIQYKN